MVASQAPPGQLSHLVSFYLKIKNRAGGVAQVKAVNSILSAEKREEGEEGRRKEGRREGGKE